jgi:hypothetical protein
MVKRVLYPQSEKKFVKVFKGFVEDPIDSAVQEGSDLCAKAIFPVDAQSACFF